MEEHKPRFPRVPDRFPCGAFAVVEARRPVDYDGRSIVSGQRFMTTLLDAIDLEHRGDVAFSPRDDEK